ncbi:2-oxoacid:ferredoxin oxidoreductase subunit beta [Patescibacteria group bacterium]|nr:2-oxoacid:ferredoxin oxidoreductase subunit beta [Patescibacteria group bacterium]MBU1890467.1 2-oxoacid:ferredoxin oxidoreductase subunit beta [Patescibacteria group bacterium]
MANQQDFRTKVIPTWCPSCGNFGMMTALTQAYADLGLEPHQIVMTFDIGCGANGANWYKLYSFHSLHGRSLPVALAVKMVNHELTVVASSGDGGGYGEGGNHMLHAGRRNIDVTYIIHNNERYSLTTGQYSPTTKTGQVTKTSPDGLVEHPINGLQLALVSGATFIARGYADEIVHLRELYKKAIKHQGFSVVEVLQPCDIFYDEKKIRQAYKSRIYKLDKSWPTKNKSIAYNKAAESGKYPIGIFYQEQRPSYTKQLSQIKKKPLVKQSLGRINIAPFVEEFK